MRLFARFSSVIAVALGLSLVGLRPSLAQTEAPRTEAQSPEAAASQDVLPSPNESANNQSENDQPTETQSTETQSTETQSKIELRTWQHPSGLYQIEGSLVTSDDTLVILQQTSGELVVLRREQLSPADREYLQLVSRSAGLAGSTGVDSGDVDSDGANAPSNELEANHADPLQTPVRQQVLPTELSAWPLQNGKILRGELVGFGKQALIVVRRRGELSVNGVSLSDLPEAYRWIVPTVVSKVDGRPLATVEELEEHIAEGGGGPFEYLVEGIQLDLDAGGAITIPLPLLDPAFAAVVEPGFVRWQAAQLESVSEEDRYAANTRERLILDSYERLRRNDAVRARDLKLLELDLLSVNAGITDIWEVTLLPVHPYGFPRSVLVPGRTSLAAQQIALQAFPGWQLGPVRKISN
jgi:hypothetical protein